MKTKYTYEKPSIQIIRIEVQEAIMLNSGFGAGSQEDPEISKSKERRSFWDTTNYE